LAKKTEYITEEIEEDSDDDLEILYEKDKFNLKPQQLTAFRFE